MSITFSPTQPCGGERVVHTRLNHAVGLHDGEHCSVVRSRTAQTDRVAQPSTGEAARSNPGTEHTVIDPSTPSTYRPQLQFFLPLPQHRLLDALMSGRSELWILLQQGEGFQPRLVHEVAIPHHVGDAEFGHSPLAKTKKFPWPSNP